MCITQLFEAQVKKTPEAVAVALGMERLSYGELNRRANRLARHLRSIGVGAEVVVGVHAERSPAVVVAILGILKAGGAYLPLDPEYPRELLEYMVKDSGAALLLSRRCLAQTFPSGGVPVIYLEEDWGKIGRGNGEEIEWRAAGRDLAYIMYTSGSTGRPKGVQVGHESLRCYVDALAPVLDLCAGDIYLHTASFSFSSSVRQLFVPLAAGSRIEIATSEQTRDTVGLLGLIRERNVTFHDTVQSVWRHALQELREMDALPKRRLLSSRLKCIVFSGDLLTYDLLRAMRSDLGTLPRVVNIYGQTETIGVSSYTVPDAFEEDFVSVPVGRPLPYVQVRILDARLEPVLSGATGELYVSGPGLARGYLNLPWLTAETFISDPSDGQLSSRLYRTGDLARYLPDGRIQILGRVDGQVKIRGVRIELGQVEVTLRQFGGMRQCAVLAHGGDGETRLVAYVVLAPGREVGADELRAFLTHKLPGSMIPASFVRLDSLPLTQNNKLDRRALSALGDSPPKPGSRHAPPRTATERAIAEIWTRVLGIRDVGIDDSFFDLGGHSLQAMQIISRIRKAFSIELSLRTLFEIPTVAGIAVHVETLVLTLHPAPPDADPGELEREEIEL